MPSRRRPASATPAPRRCRRRASACSPSSAFGRSSPADAQPITTIEITDSSLDARLRPHLPRLRRRFRPGESGRHMVENADLARALMQRSRASQPSRSSRPTVSQASAATPFELRCSLPTAGAAQRKLLVAADGKRSRLRERCRHQMRELELSASRHRRPRSRMRSRIDGKAVQHFLPGGPFAILPLKGNRSLASCGRRTKATRQGDHGG